MMKPPSTVVVPGPTGLQLNRAFAPDGAAAGRGGVVAGHEPAAEAVKLVRRIEVVAALVTRAGQAAAARRTVQ